MENSLFKSLVEKDICFGLRKITRRITNYYDYKLKDLDIRSTQLFILMAFDDEDYDGMTLNSMSDLMDMQRTTLSRNVVPLIRSGYIIGRRCKDLRSRSYTLTQKGLDIISLASKVLEGAQREMLDLFGESKCKRILEDFRYPAEYISKELAAFERKRIKGE